MGSPLMISLDLEHLNAATKKILLNKDIIAINRDALGRQAKRVLKNDIWQVFVKPLANGDVAVGFLNTSGKAQSATFDLEEYGIAGKRKMKNLWTGKVENSVQKQRCGRSHMKLWYTGTATDSVAFHRFDLLVIFFQRSVQHEGDDRHILVLSVFRHLYGDQAWYFAPEQLVIDFMI